MLIFLEATMLSVAAILGVSCSLSDLKQGIVPNKFLLIAAACGIVLHGLFLVFGGAPYYPTWLLNMALADIIAFILFSSQMWAAGDAKLFMILYFLTPPMLLDANTLIHCVVPYIYIFVPALGWTIMDSFFHLVRRDPRRVVKIHVKKILLRMALVLIEATALHSIINCLAATFVSENEMFISLAVMGYAYFCGENRWMQRWFVVTAHALLLTIATAIGAWQIAPLNWFNCAFILCVLGIQSFAGLYNYQQIATCDVKKGMILSAEAVVQFQRSRIHSLPSNPSEQINARLTGEEADAVHRWGSSVNGLPTLWIVRKIPFAIMISFGFILWILIRIAR